MHIQVHSHVSRLMMLRVLTSINAALKNARKWLRDMIHAAEELIVQADKKLFQISQFSSGCIHQLLPLLLADKNLLGKGGHPALHGALC